MEAPVIAAIITCGGTIITLIVNLYYSSKGKEREERVKQELQLGQQHFDERMTVMNTENMKTLEKTRIDASIKAKSRIEWIQNVRKEVAILMGLYHSILSSYDDFNELKRLRLRMIEQTNLVILYFGNDREFANKRPDLMSVETNKGKNDQIVSLLLELQKSIDIYCEKTTEEEYKKLKDNYEQILSQYDKHITGIDNEQDIVIDGETHHTVEYILDDDYAKKLSDKKKQLDETLNSLLNLNSEIRKNVCTIRDVIRLYLKIEWDIAKEGV